MSRSPQAQPEISASQDRVPVATILLQRRLDDPDTGSAVYLLNLMERLVDCGFTIRIVVAPVAGFGSIPISRPADCFTGRSCEIVWPGSIRIGNLFISTRHHAWIRAAKRGLAQARWILRGRKGPRPAFRSGIGGAPSDADIDRMTKVANRVRSTITVAEYSSLAPLLERCDTRVKAVLLHDLFSTRADSFRAAGLKPDHRDISLQTELKWLQSADLCLHASFGDFQRLVAKLPDKRHIWLPPKIHLRQTDRSGPLRAVFIGVRHGGNLDALDLLLTDIWPAVHAAVPGAELWIVGEICQAIDKPPPGVVLRGHVRDLAGIGGPNAIGLAPIRAASGISIKIATYLELGMSVLASKEAAEGYGGLLDDLLILAETPEEFSERLIAMLSDPCIREQAARATLKAEMRVSDTTFQAYLSDLARQ